MLSDHDLGGHVRVEGAQIVVRPGLGKSAGKALPGRERHYAADAIVEHERMWRTVIVAPGNAFSGVNGNQVRVERKIRDRHLGSTARIGAGLGDTMHNELARPLT